MKKELIAILLLILTALAETAAPAGDKSAQTAALVERAHDASDIRAPGSPPFHLEADVDLVMPDSPPVHGTVVMNWAAEDQWREDIEIPGYNCVVVENHTQHWRKSAAPYEPFSVFEALTSLVTYPEKFSEKGARVRQRTDGATSLECAEARTAYGDKHEYCVDAATGYLASDHDGTVWYDYANFAAAGKRWFPQTARVFLAGRPVAEVHIVRLSMGADLSPSLFAPLTGPDVRSLSDCKDGKIKPAKAIYSPAPPYPLALRHLGEQGTVVMWATIGTDGLPYGLTVLHSAGADLDPLAVATVRQWRYKPTTCGGVPIDVQTQISVHFALR